MKKYILILILTFSLVSANISNIIYLNLEIFRNDTVLIKDLKIDSGYTSNFPKTETKYKIKIYSYSKQVIWENNLPVSFRINMEELGTIETNKTVINIRIPYMHDAEKIKIYKNGKEIFNIDLKDYVCNKNNICDFGENELNCPNDCGRKFYEILFIIPLLFVLTIIIYFIIRKIIPKSSQHN